MTAPLDTSYLRGEDELMIWADEEAGKDWPDDVIHGRLRLILWHLVEERRKNADDGWVSVEERLPDEVVNVLMFTGTEIIIGYREKGVDYLGRRVTHWKLLAPPKETK